MVPAPLFADSRAVPCPAVVGDKNTQLYFPGKSYRCYRNKKDAARSGFLNSKIASQRDFTGWWRFGLNLTKNTCSDVSDFEGRTTVFLQVKQTESGLFAGMCPGQPKFAGKTALDESGFSIATADSLRGDPDCGGDSADIQYSFEAKRVSADTNTAGYARLARIKSCSSVEHGTFTCTTEWTGAGSREKPDHRFWPTVSENVNSFGDTCAQALTLCSGCHG